MDTYEKKYNEALERARKIHDEIVNNEVIGFPGQITDIFPELRESESEDERIRKGIKCYVEDMPDTYGFAHGIGKADMLAWLERQKEQKSVEWSEQDEKIMQTMIKEGDLKPSEIAWLKSIRPQPKAEWSEEDERIRKKLIEIIGYFRSRGIDQQLCEEFITYLEKQQEQKPAESSTNLDEILDDYFANFNVPEHQIIFEDTFRKIAKDFYELGRNSKPAEWSEEDEKIMQTMIKDGDLKPSEIAWLKSLRPSWKPSEEQEEPEYYQHFDPDC